MGKARAKASKGKKTKTVKDLTVKDAKAVKGGAIAPAADPQDAILK